MLFSDLADLTNRICDRLMTPIEKAVKAGTLGQVDRSRQYQEMTSAELVKAINDAWTKIRHCEQALKDRDKTIAELQRRLGIYRVKYTAVVAIVTGLAWEGVKYLVGALPHLLR